MSKVYRIYVEKRKDYAVEADEILNNLKTQLKIDSISDLKVVNRYDVQGVDEDVLNQGIPTILSEPMVDDVHKEDYPTSSSAHVFAIEFLPGQYDQRADACEQCFQLLTGEKNVKVKCARLIVLVGELADEQVKRIQDYLINPVDQRLATLDKVTDLTDQEVHIDAVPVIDGFMNFSDEELKQFIKDNGMAMNYDDLKVTQDYYKNEEKRDPTETELKVLDTYWSDHCRHTTFATIITNLDIENGTFKEILEKDVEAYKASRQLV